MEITSRMESLRQQLGDALSYLEVPLPETKKTGSMSSHDSGVDLLSEASFRIPQCPRSQPSSNPPVTPSKTESRVENEIQETNTVQNKEKTKKYKPKVVDEGVSSKISRKSPENSVLTPDMKVANAKAPTTPVAPDVKSDLEPLSVDKNTPCSELSLGKSSMGMQLNSELGAKSEKLVRRQLNFDLGDIADAVMHGEMHTGTYSRQNQAETVKVECLVEEIDRLALKDCLIHLATLCLRGVKRKRGKKSPKSTQMLKENLNPSDNALVPYQGNTLTSYQENALVPYEEEKFKYRGIVALDEDSITEWNILMGEDKRGSNSAGLNPEREEKWRKERENFKYLAEWFIANMKLIQGDRCFSRWKGSVVDSVVGAFLTQNVTDQLSSSAFISLCARFPQRQDVDVTSTEKQIPDFEVTKPHMINEPSCASDIVNPHESKTQNTSKGNTHGSPKSNKANTPRKKGYKMGMDDINWDALRKEASRQGYTREGKSVKTEHAADWDAVRQAETDEVAKAIRGRGQDNVLAKRIQDFLNRVVKDHGSMDLDWLRATPGDQAKEYLLSIYGLGLKSVECVRLLSLHQVAFPVDTNVGRIAVRLGWVPLQPLPDSVQMHLLESYPVLDTVQKYLWPRLCKLDQETLYELHYHMITFGKVFCTKSKPNCNACPLRSNCKHFASAFASARLMLPEPQQHQGNKIVLWNGAGTASDNASNSVRTSNCEPIIEEPMTPEEEKIVEEDIPDIEDLCLDYPNEIPTINLNMESFVRNIEEIVKKNDSDLQTEDISKALVLLPPVAASIPPPKLKHSHHLRTVHQAYELPDGHPILRQLEFEERDPTDPYPYLLILYVPANEVADCQPCDCNSCKKAKSCNVLSEDASAYVKCSILIPCRTAMKGNFPLNGTYFQVNEVFADHCTTRNPVMVDTDKLWRLRKCSVFMGSTVSAILKGLQTDEIQRCFWRGYVCVREFDRVTRYPKDLSSWLHLSPSKKMKIPTKTKIPLVQ